MANKLAGEGIKEILNILNEEELTQLALTTTQNLFKKENIKNKNESIDIIIRQSSDLSTILNRKIIRREYLFRYLDEKGIIIAAPATKSSLVSRILKLWNEEGAGEPVNHQQENLLIKETVDTFETSIDEISILASKFTEWFYNIFNETEPLGEEHFWQECSLQLNIISDNRNISNSVDSDRTEVVNLLFKTKCEHGLYFNPNLTNKGVKGKMDNHGLVLVFVCGTLHTKDNCVGVFEQMFALARDPFAENNWKIKNTLLSLKNKSTVSNMPTLENSSLNSILSIPNS